MFRVFVRSSFLTVAVICSSLAVADTPVVVKRLEQIAEYPERSAPATVISRNTTELSAEVAARVATFLPLVGDIVEAGEVIATLDCRDFELELKSARAAKDIVTARLALAERRLARAQELSKRNSLAFETLDEREAERAIEMAEIEASAARIAQARVAVSRCTVKSPFRGLLRERLAPVGQFAAVGTPIARLIDVGDLELSAQIQSRDLDAIAANRELEFISGARRYAVTLRTAISAIDTETRNQEVRFSFAQAAPLSGAAGQLIWRDARAHLPGKYIVRRSSDFGFFTVVEQQAQFVVIAGAQTGRASPVELPGQSLIVVDGHFALQDGQAVRLLDRP